MAKFSSHHPLLYSHISTQFLLLFLILFLSSSSKCSPLSGTSTTTDQQHNQLLRLFGCKSSGGAGLLCDPEGILSPKERHILRRQLRHFFVKTGEPDAEDKCQRKGITVGVVFSSTSQMEAASQLAERLDDECQKFVLLLLPILELDRISITHGSGVPFRGEQLHFLTNLEKPLLRQRRYREAILAVLESFCRLLDKSDEHWPMINMPAEQSREANSEEEANRKRILEEKAAERMSQASMVLIASCAVLFSMLLSITAFVLFYYLSIVRDGGLACWGESGPRTDGVYFVKEVSVEAETMAEELVERP